MNMFRKIISYNKNDNEASLQSRLGFLKVAGVLGLSGLLNLFEKFRLGKKTSKEIIAAGGVSAFIVTEKEFSRRDFFKGLMGAGIVAASVTLGGCSRSQELSNVTAEVNNKDYTAINVFGGTTFEKRGYNTLIVNFKLDDDPEIKSSGIKFNLLTRVLEELGYIPEKITLHFSQEVPKVTLTWLDEVANKIDPEESLEAEDLYKTHIIRRDVPRDMLGSVRIDMKPDLKLREDIEVNNLIASYTINNAREAVFTTAANNPGNKIDITKVDPTLLENFEKNFFITAYDIAADYLSVTYSVDLQAPRPQGVADKSPHAGVSLNKDYLPEAIDENGVVEIDLQGFTELQLSFLRITLRDAVDKVRTFVPSKDKPLKNGKNTLNIRDFYEQAIYIGDAVVNKVNKYTAQVQVTDSKDSGIRIDSVEPYSINGKTYVRLVIEVDNDTPYYLRDLLNQLTFNLADNSVDLDGLPDPKLRGVKSKDSLYKDYLIEHKDGKASIESTTKKTVLNIPVDNLFGTLLFQFGKVASVNIFNKEKVTNEAGVEIDRKPFDFRVSEYQVGQVAEDGVTYTYAEAMAMYQFNKDYVVALGVEYIGAEALSNVVIGNIKVGDKQRTFYKEIGEAYIKKSAYLGLGLNEEHGPEKLTSEAVINFILQNLSEEQLVNCRIVLHDKVEDAFGVVSPKGNSISFQPKANKPLVLGEAQSLLASEFYDRTMPGGDAKVTRIDANIAEVKVSANNLSSVKVNSSGVKVNSEGKIEDIVPYAINENSKASFTIEVEDNTPGYLLKLLRQQTVVVSDDSSPILSRYLKDSKSLLDYVVSGKESVADATMLVEIEIPIGGDLDGVPLEDFGNVISINIQNKNFSTNAEGDIVPRRAFEYLLTNFKKSIDGDNFEEETLFLFNWDKVNGVGFAYVDKNDDELKDAVFSNVSVNYNACRYTRGFGEDFGETKGLVLSIDRESLKPEDTEAETTISFFHGLALEALPIFWYVAQQDE